MGALLILHSKKMLFSVLSVSSVVKALPARFLYYGTGVSVGAGVADAWVVAVAVELPTTIST